MGTLLRLVVIGLLLFVSMLPAGPALAAEWRDVTSDRLLNADRDASNWLMYNRTYSGWRYSPLDQISIANARSWSRNGSSPAARSAISRRRRS